MNILPITTVDFSADGTGLYIVDQTQLPQRTQMLTLRTQPQIWNAINTLQVRGAPAIGIAAAIGVYLAALEIETDNYAEFAARFDAAKQYLATARPTAVNLFWALDKMQSVVVDSADMPVSAIKQALRTEALRLRDEDIDVCRSIGDAGLPLLCPGMGILTHCNAGTLATVRYGTATAPIYRAHEQGMQNLRVYCDETRPLLQGARLTAFELQAAGINTTLLCDNMAASAMQNGWVDIVFVGCDRVARNGDAANKIGTLGVAILAKHFGIPFYVCAPTSTIDMSLPTGTEIPIEQRSSEEVTSMWYKEPMAPQGINVYNPAFDVTPNHLITGIITEHGILKPAYEDAFRDIGL